MRKPKHRQRTKRMERQALQKRMDALADWAHGALINQTCSTIPIYFGAVIGFGGRQQ